MAEAPVSVSQPTATLSKRPVKHVNFAQNTKGGESFSGPLYMQSSGNVVIVRRIKRKNEAPMTQFTRWLVDNQTGLSFNLLTLLLLAHSFFPTLREHTTKFFTLSYYNPATGKYNIGSNDAYLVVFIITLLMGLRASAMEYIFAPYAKMRGLAKRKAITRFSEQAWMLTYYTIMFPMGLYIYKKSPYYLSLYNIWSDWPNREMPFLLKSYLLTQLSFYLQQIIVIDIEERRKDHWQMLTHHFITVSLITGSYLYRLTRVGNVVLMLMDVSDFFLPLAKCLKYLGHTTLCDVCFGAFMLSWFVPRHIFFSMIIYSVWKHTSVILPEGCYRGGQGNDFTPISPDDVSPLAPTVAAITRLSPATSNYLAHLLEPLFDINGSICYTHPVRWSFLSMLLLLQTIISVWFIMIVQVAIRVVSGGGAEDSRSDDESENGEDAEDVEDDRNEFVYEEAQALEEEVGVEAIDFRGWERRSGVKRSASTTSGVSLPGHSDRKELLGRIGCEKQMD